MTTYDITSNSFNIENIQEDDILQCPYTGSETSITLPAGKYKIDLTGATGNFAGRNSTSTATYTAVGGGGTSTGVLTLEEDTTLYINVGGCGETYTGTSTSTRTGGYNGGGSANSYGGVGGGATHVSYRSGLLSTLENYKSDIIIVAGGGGGSAYYGSNYYGNGGSGGGTSGTAGLSNGSSNTTYAGQGGTQSAGGNAGTNSTRKGTAGSFGQGGSNTNGTSSYASAAGGGGYYGGGAASNQEAGGGGGSGYVSSVLTESLTSTGTSTTTYSNGTCNITVLELSSVVRHEINLSLSGGNFTSNHSNGSYSIREGASQSYSFIPLNSEDKINAYINGTNVTDSLLTETLTSSLSITPQRTGASYGFALSNGYYVSQNKGVAKSAAVARVNIVAVQPSIVTFNVINYAEEGYDFGVLGLLDEEIQPVYNSDNSGYWSGFSSDHNTSSVQTITYSVPIGEHFIDVKYIKDDATDENNDTLQFQVSMNPSAGSTVTQYTLNTGAVTQNLEVEIICGDISNNFAVTANGEHAIIQPKQQNIYKGSDCTLTFTLTDTEDYRYVTTYDNNTDVGNIVIPPHTMEAPSYSVESVSGASYGFSLSNGYYQSQNTSNNTAALCKVVFNAPVTTLVTITYQNTGNSTSNFSMISELNTDLRTDYATDTSGIYMNGSSNFHSSDTTLEYTIPAGTSYITCKHKISSNSGTKGNLKFKVAMAPLESLEVPYYTYSISNIQSIHNILVISEKIPVYNVNITCGPMGSASPSGTLSAKEGSNITVIGTPETNYELTQIYINSQPVVFSETGEYTLSNIQSDTNIYLLFTSGSSGFYINNGGTWTPTIQAYKKVDGRWEEQEYALVGDPYTKYVNKS